MFPKKLKIELPHDPAIPLLGKYPEKNIIQKDKCSPVYLCSTAYKNDRNGTAGKLYLPVLYFDFDLKGLFPDH